MPQYTYRGRNKEGQLFVGQRFSATIDQLNADLSREGIIPISIENYQPKESRWEKTWEIFQRKSLLIEELSIFIRQMQLLHRAGVSIVVALKQLSDYTRSKRLKQALLGMIDDIEKGQSLAAAMQNYPAVFSKLMTNIILIGENTGHLTEAFGHLHKYLDFETQNKKQLKSAFRYPIFVLFAIIVAIVILNVFVIPSFAKFYTNLSTPLPWQTRLLIGMSNVFLHHGFYLLVVIFLITFFCYNYFQTPQGKFNLDKYLLRVPIVGNLLKRLYIIRFSQSFAIILNSGIPVTQGLNLINKLLNNIYLNAQIENMQESIERGNTFTQSIAKIDLFTPMELQILAVGEKNGEFGPALDYIANFHSHELTFELKRINDLIGPVLITAVAILILIIALGVYLPIWNMITLVH